MRKLWKSYLAAALAFTMTVSAASPYGEGCYAKAAGKTEADGVGISNRNGRKAALVTPDFEWSFESVTDGKAANTGSVSGGEAALQGTAKVETADIQIGDKTYSGAGNHVLTLSGGSKGSSYVDLPANLYENVDAKTGFTYSFWMKADNGVASYSRAISSATAGNKNEFAFAPYAADKVWNVIFDDDNLTRSLFQEEPKKNIWNYITFTVSAEEIVLYVNGERADSNMNAGDEGTLTARLNSMAEMTVNALGKTCSGWGDADCAVQMDDVRLYKKVLTPEQVADSANQYGFTAQVTKPVESVGQDSEKVYTDGTELTEINELATLSPDGTVAGKILQSGDGRFFYAVTKNNESVLHASMLGMITDKGDLSTGLSLVEGSVKKSEINESYDLIAGSKAAGSNHCNELRFDVKNSDGTVLTIILRVYDDGVAYRYAMESTGSVSVQKETGDVVFPDNTVTWSFTPGVNYEETFQKRKLSALKNAKTNISTPLLASVEDDKYWVMMTEGSVFNEEKPYCASYFSTDSGEKNLRWVFGNKQTGSVKMPASFHTPWRIAIVTDNLNDLVTSDIVTDVNPASKVEDTSWIKPGKIAWSWWSSAGDFPIEFGTQKDYIDFAAENGWEYVCLDYGWVLWDDYKAKVEELCDYAEQKGIGLFLWYGVNNVGHTAAGAYPKYSLLDKETIEREIKWASEVGVKGVKVDYYESDNQDTMQQMYWCADCAAKNQIMVIFHGCTLPNGEHRTYPNILSYEAVFGEEYHKWGENPNAANCLTYLFTRNIVGGMDFTPTAMRVNANGATTGFQLAETVVFENPIPMYAQSIYNYQGYGALAFLNDVATTWDETKLVDGYPGTYNAVARRHGDDLYLGLMTLAQRTADCKLDFLGDGEYTAYIYSTNESGTDVKLETRTVTKADSLQLALANKDGAVVKLSKKGMDTSTLYDQYKYYEAEDAVLSGTAKSHVDSNQYASGMKSVGYVGGGADNSITFQNVEVEKAGSYKFKIFFISGEKRDLYVKINDDAPVVVKDMVANQGDWMVVSAREVLVTLPVGKNTIKLYNDTADAPGIDRIGICYDGVKLSETNIQLRSDGTKQLSATLGENLTGEKIHWTSTDESVATVDENGLVQAVSKGNAVILAKAGNSVAACTVAVVTMAEKITLSKDTVSLVVDYNGDSYYYDEEQTRDEIKATVLPVNASGKRVSWSSDNENILVSDGVISVKEGLKEDITGAKITVSSMADPSVQAVCTVNVRMNHVAEVIRSDTITVTPSKADVKPGETLQMKADVKPANAKDTKVIWSIKESDRDKASVTEQGLVTIDAVETTTVTVIATARDNQAVTAQADLTVNADRELVAEYDFENSIGSGKTVGSKTTLAANSSEASYTEGVNGGKAVAIKGAGSDGVVLDTVPKDETYTIAFWMQAKGSTTYSPAIFIGAADQTEQAWVSVGQGWQASWDTAPMIWSNASNTYYDVVPSKGIRTGEWNHITLVVNNGEGSIYVNGEKTASGKVASVIGKDTKIFLGVNAWDTPFDGAIDELRIFDRALTENEIPQLTKEHVGTGNNTENNGTNTQAKKVTVKAAGYMANQITMVKGKTLKLVGDVSPKKAEQGVVYKSSKPAVASVTDAGVVKAKKAGKTVITALSGDGKAQKKITITVSNKAVTNKKLVLKKQSYSLKKKGAVTALAITKLTKNTTDKITYKILSGKKYIKVNAYGEITCKVKPSGKKVTAKVQVKCGKAKKQVTVQIKK